MRTDGRQIGSVLAATLIAAVLYSGCSSGVKRTGMLAWPPPPEKPVIVYVGSIYGSRNLDRSFFGRMNDFLFGR